MASPVGSRSRNCCVAIGLVALSLGLAAWLLAAGVRLTDEDGFYYFGIARHLAHGDGSTFDGANATNGYHPLWLGCLIPVFWLTGDDHAALVAGAALQAFLMAAAVVAVHTICRRLVSGPAAVLAALAWLRISHRLSLSGVEFALHSCAVLWSAEMYRLCSRAGRTWRSHLGLGLLLSLAFLARLETILLAVAMGVGLLRHEWRVGTRRDGAIRLLAFSAPLVAVCAAYASLNAILFGCPVPVSGLVRRAWSETLLARDPVYLSSGLFVAKVHHAVWPLFHLGQVQPLSLALGTFGALALWLASRRRGAPVDPLDPLEPFLAYGLVAYLGYVLAYHGDLSFAPRYFVVQPWLAVWLGAALLDRAAALVPRPTMLWIVVGSLVLLSTLRTMEGSRLRLQAGPPDPLYEASLWVRATLPPDTVVGAWNAGTMGFLSGRRVINLDGVANSWDYFLHRRHDLCAYWRRVGVTHVVDVFEAGRALSVVPTFDTYAACADRLERVWSDDRYGSPWRVEAYRIRRREAGP